MTDADRFQDAIQKLAFEVRHALHSRLNLKKQENRNPLQRAFDYYETVVRAIASGPSVLANEEDWEPPPNFQGD